MICNLGDPMSLRHPVTQAIWVGPTLLEKKCNFRKWSYFLPHGFWVPVGVDRWMARGNFGVLCVDAARPVYNVKQYCINGRRSAVWTHCKNCNTLQHTAIHCNTLQHTATHCNTHTHTQTILCVPQVTRCSNIMVMVDQVSTACTVTECKHVSILVRGNFPSPLTIRSVEVRTNIQRGSSWYSEQAWVRAEIKPFCGSQNF